MCVIRGGGRVQTPPPAPPPPAACPNTVIYPCQMLPQPFVCHSTHPYIHRYTHYGRGGSSLAVGGEINREGNDTDRDRNIVKFIDYPEDRVIIWGVGFGGGGVVNVGTKLLVTSNNM